VLPVRRKSQTDKLRQQIRTDRARDWADAGIRAYGNSHGGGHDDNGHDDAASLPSVSVVTPSYNTGRFIADTVRSVVAQDYPESKLEYLVFDGASTDDTPRQLRACTRENPGRFRWVSEPDEGQSDAINKGFARTSGDVLGWLNSDDTYAPGAVRAAAEYLRDHPNVALVYGDANFIDARGRLIARCAHVEPYNRHRLLHYSDFIVQPAAFFRRSAFEAVGGLDVSLHWAMDYDLWLKLAERYEVAYLPRVLANYRWVGDNKSASGGRDRLDEVEGVARRHGARRPPAYFVLERVNLELQAARTSLRRPATPAVARTAAAAACAARAAGTLLRSGRAIRSLFSPQTWRIIHTGQVLRARAAAAGEAVGFANDAEPSHDNGEHDAAATEPAHEPHVTSPTP
jgi:hypothetical protein